MDLAYATYTDLKKERREKKQKNELHTYKKQWKMVNIHISKRTYRNIPSRK